MLAGACTRGNHCPTSGPRIKFNFNFDCGVTPGVQNLSAENTDDLAHDTKLVIPTPKPIRLRNVVRQPIAERWSHFVGRPRGQCLVSDTQRPLQADADLDQRCRIVTDWQW